MKIPTRKRDFQEHALKPNKKNNIPRYIVSLDTEANMMQNGDLNYQNLRLGWAIYEDLIRGTKKEIEFKDINTFYSFLKSLRMNKKKIWIFAHNFDYDAQILDLLRIAKYMNGEIRNFIIDSRNFIINFKHKWMEGNKKKSCTYVFLSTTNYFKDSLKKLGKMLGLEKMEVDLKTASNKELSIYCHRDTEILHNMVKYYINFIVSYNLGNFQYTIASQSFNAYRHRFMKHKIYIHGNQEAIEMEVKSYKGGRTEAFELGEISKHGKIYKLDINSMYPYVMRFFDFPTKLLKVIKNPSLPTLRHYLKDYIIIAEIDFQIDKPAIGVKRDRLIFPIGKIHDVITSPELEYIFKHGKINKVYKMAIYEKHKIFESWVKELYTLRQKYKKDGNDVMQYFVKILLNSLYGKFGQKIEEMDFKEESGYNDPIALRYWNVDKHEWQYFLNIDGKVYEKGKSYLTSHSFPAISALVTAYARMYLWNLIEKAGMENVFYCDTDSLFTNEKGFINLKEYIDNKELGKLKLEEIGDYVYIYNVKDYIFNEEVKLKGIKKKARKISNNQYEQEQFIRIRGNIGKYHYNGALVKTVKKVLRREYLKGNVDKNNRIKPFELKEWG